MRSGAVFAGLGLLLVSACATVDPDFEPGAPPAWPGGDTLLEISRSGQLDFSSEHIRLVSRTDGVGPDARGRLVVRHDYRLSNGVGTRWADLATCPAVQTVFESAENITAATVDFPGMGVERRGDYMILDGSSVTLKTEFATADGAHLDLEVRGNEDSPAWTWWTTQAPLLENCWSDTPPA